MLTGQSDVGAGGHTFWCKAHVLQTLMDEVTITASFRALVNTLHCSGQIWWIFSGLFLVFQVHYV